MADETAAAAASEEVTGNVILVSQDGEKFTLPAKLAQKSVLIKTMADEDVGDDDEDPEIPLPNVKANVLAKVVEFLRHSAEEPMKDIEKPLKSSLMPDIVNEWYAKFVDEMERELLFEVILAANYMDIKPLMDLTCAKIASLIKGKTPEEIRKEFNIVNDFTPEEEAQVREENRWAEEA